MYVLNIKVIHYAVFFFDLKIYFYLLSILEEVLKFTVILKFCQKFICSLFVFKMPGENLGQS